MKITRRQLRSIIREAYSVGDPNVDNLQQPLFTTDARKGFKLNVNKMNELKDTKFKLNSLNQFVKDFFDDSKPEFDSKQLVLKILHMKQAADLGIGYHGDEKKEIEKALELAEEATGFVASDEYLTQRGKDVFSKGGKYDPEIEASNYLRRGREGYSIEGDEEINENSKKLNRRHLRRLIKEELTKKLLSESQFRVPDPKHRGELFLNYGGSNTELSRDVESSSGTYDASNAPDWERTEPWFNDARMFSRTLGIIDNFYRTTKAFTDFSEVYNKTPQELADFLLEKIANAKEMISAKDPKDPESKKPKHEFIYEPQAIEMYLDVVEEKLNTLKDSIL